MVANILQHLLHPLRHRSPYRSDGPKYRRAWSRFVPVHMIPSLILYFTTTYREKIPPLPRPSHHAWFASHSRYFFMIEERR